MRTSSACSSRLSGAVRVISYRAGWERVERAKAGSLLRTMRPVMNLRIRSIADARKHAARTAAGAGARPLITFAERAILTVVVVLAGLVNHSLANPGKTQANDEPLTQLSLAELGNVVVTTTSKEPEEVWKTPAAVFVLTEEDIRRSGATSIPEALRLVPGVQVSRIYED